MTKIQKRLSMIALLLANFIGGLDTTMLNTALPQIIKDLNGINQLGLLTSMLLFFIAMTTVLWGKLGEVIGNKKAFQLSILIFTIASILGGFSVNIWMMVFARGLMGIGIGGMIGGLVVSQWEVSFLPYVSAAIGLAGLIITLALRNHYINN